MAAQQAPANLVALAMPLISLSFMELLKHTIDQAELTPQEKKKLKELVENSIKVAPITSHISIQKGTKSIEIFIALEDREYNLDNDIKAACEGLTQAECKQVYEQAGNLIYMVNLYFDSIKVRVPDVFRTIKNKLKIPDNPEGLPNNHDDVLDGVFINVKTKKMYIDYRCPKQLMPKFRVKTVEPDKPVDTAEDPDDDDMPGLQDVSTLNPEELSKLDLNKQD